MSLRIKLLIRVLCTSVSQLVRVFYRLGGAYTLIGCAVSVIVSIVSLRRWRCGEHITLENVLCLFFVYCIIH
jgi:hypothetical protein